jgi:hypothetical protein
MFRMITIVAKNKTIKKEITNSRITDGKIPLDIILSKRYFTLSEKNVFCGFNAIDISSSQEGELGIRLVKFKIYILNSFLQGNSYICLLFKRNYYWKINAIWMSSG